MSARKMLALALLAGPPLAGLCGPAPAGTWSDLWSTHEQQGQKQLDGNHPSEAARLFSDPKRRAYAEAQAGQYGKAADLLAPMKDADSKYNRGNALARGGKLQDALAAYDAALAASPGNEDVLRNRDLVAKALENQQQGKDGSDKNGKGQQGQGNSGQGSGGAGDKQSGGKDSGAQNGKSGQAQSQAGQQSQSAQQGHSGQQGQSAQQGQSGQQEPNGNPAQANVQNQPKGAGQPQSGQQSQTANPQQGTNSAAASQQAQANPSQNNNSATAANATNSALPPNPQQGTGAFATNPPGQRDQPNATALRQGQTSGTGTQRGAENMADSPLVKGGIATDSHQSQPRSEQALALDQWLRSIPEDSGELLRRKFQIEHLMKKQGNEP